MATYKKVAGAGNENCRYVFRISFSSSIVAEPLLAGWDDGNCNTTNKVFFTGTSGNSNEPMIIVKATTTAAPGNNWVNSVAKTSGGAAANKLRGDTYYIKFPNNSTTQYFNIAFKYPYDISTGDYSGTLQLIAFYQTTQPTITFHFNSQTDNGNETTPYWVEWSDSYSMFWSNNGGNTTTIRPLFIPESGQTIAPETWVQVG